MLVQDVSHRLETMSWRIQACQCTAFVLYFFCQQANRVSAEEFQSVLDADFLWSGKLWETGEEVILVLEASWKVHENDVERAVQRAEVLRRAGLKALPVTAGEEWPEQVEALALRERAVITRDGWVDDASWQAALASLQMAAER